MTATIGSRGASIEGRAITKTFNTADGQVHALAGLDFRIEPGEFVSLIGPSGCGKSTLMLIAAGLIPASSGRMLVDGTQHDRPLTDVGIVFQDHLLLDFRTAIDNILLQPLIRGMALDAARPRAIELLRKLGLEQAAKRYPRQLSGGMRQRVSIARALIHEPSILLMDEPFGALDALTRTQMRHDLEVLWLETAKTVLFITHSIDEAIGLSDRVLVMSAGPGRIVDEIKIDLPRPRPAHLGEYPSFDGYAERIHRTFRQLGVIRF
ncbi:MAG: ABC transporter ATP-binding protein [Alphaproteobacteria bacterium]|nr:ABC transporter ATP-binding protein [Alphaproteobacteria bacterium]